MRRICNNISDFFCQKGIISFEDRNEFRFALELIITQLITLISILLLGLVMDECFEIIICSVLFVLARKVFDGYHANTFLSCYLLTMTFFIIFLLLAKLNIDYIYLNILTLLMVFIYMKNHQQENKKVIVYIVFYSVSLYLLYLFGFKRLVNMCSLLLFAVLMVSKVGGIKHGDSSS